MKASTNPGIVPGRPFHAFRQGFRSTFLTINACIGMGALAYACQPEIRPWSDYPFEIEVHSPAPGEARIQILAGNETTPMDKMLGFELEMDLRSTLGSGSEIAFFPASGWATGDGNFTAEVSLDCENQHATLRFDREECASVSGHGKIGEIWISGLEPGFDPANLVRIAGGIVIEEIVIGVRMASTGIGVSDVSLDSSLMPGAGIGEVVLDENLSPRSNVLPGTGIGEVVLGENLRPTGQAVAMELNAYPQPAGAQVQIALQAPQPTEMRLYDQQGHVLQTRAVSGTGHYQMDLQALPAGTYLLRCESQNGDRLTRRVVHR